MNITFAFKNFEPSEHLKRYARRRFEKMGRFLGKSADLEVRVALTVDKIRQKVDVQLTGEGLQLAATEQTEDMYASIDLVLDKLESQIKRHISKSKERKRPGRNNTNIDVFTFPLMDENGERTISGSDHFSPKPMHLDEAAMQLENLGFDFLVFINAECERVNVIYRRKSGDYGLIDPVL